MTDHATIIDVSRYHPVAGKRQELLTAMKELAEDASSSDGCFGAQACESDQDSEALIAISRWESPEALDAFANLPSFVRKRDALKSLLAKQPTREHLLPK